MAQTRLLPMTSKVVLLALLVAMLLTAGAPLHANVELRMQLPTTDPCDPTAGDACEMPDPTRWRATDVDYLPLVVKPRAVFEVDHD